MSTTYSATEVHALLFAAYERGRYDADLNDLHGMWAERAEPRATREERVATRVAAMETIAGRERDASWNTWRGRYPGGAVDWETGAIVRRELRAAA